MDWVEHPSPRAPLEARLTLVSAGAIVPRATARRRWRDFSFLKSDPRAKGGWAAEVLGCVREIQGLQGDDFTLTEFYAHCEDQLAGLHPGNRHVRAKVRQQLQVFRDGGVLAFLGAGRYRIVA